MYQKLIVVGNLGRDPEMRYTPSHWAVTNFNVAVGRSWKSADGEKHSETEWFNVVAWGGLAEICHQYLFTSTSFFCRIIFRRLLLYASSR